MWERHNTTNLQEKSWFTQNRKLKLEFLGILTLGKCNVAVFTTSTLFANILEISLQLVMLFVVIIILIVILILFLEANWVVRFLNKDTLGSSPTTVAIVPLHGCHFVLSFDWSSVHTSSSSQEPISQTLFWSTIRELTKLSITLSVKRSFLKLSD